MMLLFLHKIINKWETKHLLLYAMINYRRDDYVSYVILMFQYVVSIVE